MDTDSSGVQATTLEEAVPGKAGRPPPIIIIFNSKLIQLQKQLKNVVKGEFKFRKTKNGTTFITKSMADYEAVKSHFFNSNLPYYSFFPKSQNSSKVVIHHLPPNFHAEDISDELVTLGFDVVRVKEMTTTRPSPSKGTTTRNLLLFLISVLGRQNHKKFSTSKTFVTFPSE
jgi:hypothetical protein